MRRINSLSDLLMEELADLLNAENQSLEFLPKLADASQLPALRRVLEDHLVLSKEHIRRLENIFNNIAQRPQGVICETVRKIISESDEVIHQREKGISRDAAIVSIVSRVELYEIDEYQTACEHAVILGHTQIVEILNKTLDEERIMNSYLNELAQFMINVQAIDPTGSQKFVRKGSRNKPKKQ